jgi:hypothetical protein
VFGTNVGNKFLVTLGFVPLPHCIKRIAMERTGRVKHPVTFGATEAHKILALNPYQFAWHCMEISVRPLPDFSPPRRKIDVPHVTRQRVPRRLVWLAQPRLAGRQLDSNVFSSHPGNRANRSCEVLRGTREDESAPKTEEGVRTYGYWNVPVWEPLGTRSIP